MQKDKSLIKKITGSREASLVVVLIVLLAVISVMSPSFLSLTNISQIFRNNALTMLMALGMLCVMLTAGIDISITSVLAFSGMTIGLMQKYDVLHSTPLLFLAGVLSVSIYASAQPNMQYGKEMDVIAACVIGGVSMNGGRGSVVGTFLGALIIGVIAKALPLIGIDAIAQNLVKGAIILVVVVLNVITQRMIDRQALLRREM